MKNNSFPKLYDNDGNELDIINELEKLNKKMDSKVDWNGCMGVAAVTVTLIVGLLAFTNNLVVEINLTNLEKDHNELKEQLEKDHNELKEKTEKQMEKQTKELKEINKELRKELNILENRLIQLEERIKSK